MSFISEIPCTHDGLSVKKNINRIKITLHYLLLTESK